MTGIENLPDGWAVVRADGMWHAGRMSNGCAACDASFLRLASAATIDDAIRQAREHEEAEILNGELRATDYARRREAGQLTKDEEFNEIMAPLYLQAIEEWSRPSVVRKFLSEMPHE